MRFILIAMLFALAGCSAAPEPEGPKAERELTMLRSTSPSKDEECEAMRKVAEAYLRDQNHEQYRKADMFADTTCLLAETERLL